VPLRSLLIYNPAAGSRRPGAALPRLLAALSRGGFQVEPTATTAPGDATRLAREAAGDGVERVFVFGGDGTVREAAVGLQGTEVALGILPGGTANVLGRALGLPRHPLDAAEAMQHLTPQRFDVGECGASPFLMMASAGLDAQVMCNLDLRRKARFGRLGILLDGLGSWWSYGYPEIRLTADGEPCTATLAVASNIPLYGGSFRIAPEARWDDGQLDLVLFRGRGRVATLAFAVGLALGRHVHRPDVEIRRVSEVVFKGPEGIALQIDGDACAEPLPARVTVGPEPVWVLAPG
jgi:diacylglycerol kinase (ATP)